MALVCKRLSPNSIDLSSSKAESSGTLFYLRSIRARILISHTVTEIHSGLQLIISRGYFGEIISLSSRPEFIASGIISHNYQEEVVFKLENTKKRPYAIRANEPVALLYIKPILQLSKSVKTAELLVGELFDKLTMIKPLDKQGLSVRERSPQRALAAKPQIILHLPPSTNQFPEPKLPTPSALGYNIYLYTAITLEPMKSTNIFARFLITIPVGFIGRIVSASASPYADELFVYGYIPPGRMEPCFYTLRNNTTRSLTFDTQTAVAQLIVELATVPKLTIVRLPSSTSTKTTSIPPVERGKVTVMPETIDDETSPLINVVD